MGTWRISNSTFEKSGIIKDFKDKIVVVNVILLSLVCLTKLIIEM